MLNLFPLNKSVDSDHFSSLPPPPLLITRSSSLCIYTLLLDIVFFRSINFSFISDSTELVDRCALHVRPHVSYMYEDINICLLHLNLTDQSIIIDVLFLQIYCEDFLIVVDVNRMADADNRVILNVGGIRHETCMYPREREYAC